MTNHGPLIAQTTTERGATDSVFVFTSQRDRPVTLMIDQLDPGRLTSCRHALAPLDRRQAARVALHLLLAALTPSRWALEQDHEDTVAFDPEEPDAR